MAHLALSYHPALRIAFRLLGLGPRRSGVDIDDSTMTVRLGWGFRARIERTAITAAAPNTGRVMAWGAHGWRGRWLVNGSSQGIVVLTIDPPGRGRVLGWPITVRELAVSMDDPGHLLELVGAG
jgi:hypothetical protein